MAFLRYLYIIAALSFELLGHCYCLQLNEPPDQICLSTFSELAAQLSPDADIVSASYPEYERWQAYKPPTFSIIVEVAVEEDVQKTVSAASKLKLNLDAHVPVSRSALRTSMASPFSP